MFAGFTLEAPADDLWLPLKGNNNNQQIFYLHRFIGSIICCIYLKTQYVNICTYVCMLVHTNSYLLAFNIFALRNYPEAMANRQLNTMGRS